jgi:NADPH:quinone reductase-like Zn-dependent oxidoreductase
MRAIEAKTFSGYGGPQQIELAKPQPAKLARAQGAGKVISTAGSAVKAAKARELGFEDVVDLTADPSSRSSSGSIPSARRAKPCAI